MPSFNPTCPLPDWNYDKIMLAHGSGGALTHDLLSKGVFELLKNRFLDEQHDGAVFQVEGDMAVSTDSFVVSPIFFPGGNIGELAVNGTLNDLAMCGAKPLYLTLGLIIEEGLPMKEFWEVLLSIQKACEDAGVYVVSGDTKVVERGKGDKIFINTTGIGKVHKDADIHVRNIRSGDIIISSGQIATHGMAIMSVREGLQFETTIQSDTMDLSGLVMEMVDAFGKDIRFLRDATRGGVATVLNEIADHAGRTVQLEEMSLPIDKQVYAACELLGLDPLYVANEGVFLAVVSPDKAHQVLDLLRSHKTGVNASIIGEVTNENDGKVILNGESGGKRVVRMLPGEQLPRIC
jgi:hydrogenase expression/formation protein HypE